MVLQDAATGTKKFTREQLHAGDTVLNQQTGTNKYASQKGMTGFGQPRLNVYKSHDKGYIEPDREGEGILKTISGTNLYASQKGHTPMGAIRLNVPKIKYKEEWGGVEMDKQSSTILTLQSGTNKFATRSGESDFGARRLQTPKISGRMPKDRRTDGIIPYQMGSNIFANQSGMSDPPGCGAYRQATTEIEGLNITEDQIRKSSIFSPITAGSNQYASQKGSGGFFKHRDVLCHTKGGKEIDPEKARETESCLPLQSGTNKYSSQKGMTGFGMPRDVFVRPKWKQEWVEQWEEAETEFEESGRGKKVDQMKSERELAERSRIKSWPSGEISAASDADKPRSRDQSADGGQRNGHLEDEDDEGGDEDEEE